MKATGVIRKIDDLGRIVIPKEIRKNFKIKEGDNLEFFVESDEVILKKYSITDNIIEISNIIVDSFYKIYKKNLIITNTDKVISASKDFNYYIDMELSNDIKSKINNRMEYLSNNNSSVVSNMKLDDKYFLVPLLANSEILGSILIINDEISDSDKELLRFINLILIKNVE